MPWHMSIAISPRKCYGGPGARAKTAERPDRFEDRLTQAVYQGESPKGLSSACMQRARRVAVPHDIRFRVQETSVSIMTGALEIKAQHGLSYWDAAIVAAARALGCRELYSEDMTHGREIDRVTIINPFR